MWDVDDREAKLLLATLNRLQGQDLPIRRAQLIHDLLGEMSLDDLAGLLPETDKQLEELHALLEFPAEEIAAQLEAEAEAAERVLPRVMSFVVSPEQEELIDRAVEAASDGTAGPRPEGPGAHQPRPGVPGGTRCRGLSVGLGRRPAALPRRRPRYQRRDRGPGRGEAPHRGPVAEGGGLGRAPAQDRPPGGGDVRREAGHRPGDPERPPLPVVGPAAHPLDGGSEGRQGGGHPGGRTGRGILERAQKGQRLAKGLSTTGETEEQVRAEAEADIRGLIDAFIDAIKENVGDEETRDRIRRRLLHATPDAQSVES